MTSTDESIVLTVDGRSCTLSRTVARELQETIGEALTERREFFRTTGEYREDGTYVVSRRGAESTGNEKVFDSFQAVERLFHRLPDEMTAEDVGRSGITGSRRHMLIRHFAEHPGFDCAISQRNPLTVTKSGDQSSDDSETQRIEVPAD